MKALIMGHHARNGGLMALGNELLIYQRFTVSVLGGYPNTEMPGTADLEGGLSDASFLLIGVSRHSIVNESVQALERSALERAIANGVPCAIAVVNEGHPFDGYLKDDSIAAGIKMVIFDTETPIGIPPRIYTHFPNAAPLNVIGTLRNNTRGVGSRIKTLAEGYRALTQQTAA